MKKVFFALGVLLFLAPILVKCQPKTVVKLKTSYFKFDLPDNLVDSGNGQGIGNALAQSTSGSILYTLNGVEHIIGTPSYTDKDLFPIHFVNKDGTWKVEKLYSDVLIGIPRNYVFIDSSTIAYADHGREYGNPWPYGNIYTVKTQGDSLKWTKISQYKSFYHSVAVGDLDNDNKYDLVGLHMGSYNPWKGNNGLHPYLQQQDGNFADGVNTIEDRQPNVGTGSVLIADIMGDSRPEVIVGTYGGNSIAYSIFSYDKDKNKYVFNKSPKEAGVFKDGQQGSTSIKLADFNNDGKMDMAIASEGYPGNQIQIWQGQGSGDFIPGQVLNYDTTLADGSKISLNLFREFEIADVNKDGFLDIIVHPFASGSKFRINPGPMSSQNPKGYYGTGIKLNFNIWMNKGGTFSTLNEDIRVPDVYPGFIKGFFINGKLKFFGFEQAQEYNVKHAVKIQEMTVYFCETLTKPVFNTTKYSFCSGDSLKLTVSNINKGDSLKWYYGTKSDLTNLSNKTFTDSTKLFVTRTDSVGCVISSDTIKITTYPKLQITTKLRTFKYNLNTYKDAAPNIFLKMHQTITQTVLYSVKGVEHIVTIPVDSVPNAPIHFINKSGNWELQSFYPNFKMDGARNYSFIDTLGNFAYANTGSEVPRPWPLGDLVVVNTINDTLKWTKVDSVKAFYHSVGTGDLNGDGLADVVGLHMQSNYWPDNLHPFLQNKNGTYSEGRNVISSDVGAHRNSSGAVLVADVLGDSKPEIIRGSYGFTGANGETRYAFEILGYDKQTNQYIKVYEPKKLGVFTDIVNGGQGATSIKSADFDHNGFQDLVICSEGNLPNSNTKGASMIQIWLNNGKGEFIPDQYIINNADDSLNIREFEVADVDNDGWLDIIMHGIGGPLYRQPIVNSKYGYYFKINNLIWKNNRGVFDIIPNQLNVYDSTNIELIGNSNFLKGFMVNGKLKFIGFECADAVNPTKLYEITVNFCNNLTKPTFSSTKYSFCTGDSLKLTVSNINKGDTLKWYYGSKSDLTNLSNKTFTDSTKLFVTRTDSLGCVISSDTVQIKKIAIPSAPTLSRDTANFLLSGAAGTTWYKDGSAITDTVQKYKPTAAGSYTAKTTTNGCTSVMSAAYYYLVTDIINLSKDEFIKLAPNPFINQLNFDFIVKGYQKLNIEVFDVATGTKVASQPNLTAGSRITLGQLSGGTYIIRVTSNDQKILQQFKVVKM